MLAVSSSFIFVAVLKYAEGEQVRGRKGVFSARSPRLQTVSVGQSRQELPTFTPRLQSRAERSGGEHAHLCSAPLLYSDTVQNPLPRE